MPLNPPITPALQRDLEAVIANGLFVYLDEFTRNLFPDFRTPEAQNCVAGGVVAAIRRYEVASGQPLSRAIALELLETKV